MGHDAEIRSEKTNGNRLDRRNGHNPDGTRRGSPAALLRGHFWLQTLRERLEGSVESTLYRSVSGALRLLRTRWRWHTETPTLRPECKKKKKIPLEVIEPAELVGDQVEPAELVELPAIGARGTIESNRPAELVGDQVEPAELVELPAIGARGTIESNRPAELERKGK